MPENLDESRQPESNAATPDYFEISRIALQELLFLSSESVAPTESEIEGRYRRASETAEEKLRESAAKIESRFEKKREEIEREHTGQIGEIDREYHAARATLVSQIETSLGRIAAEFTETEKEARRERDDDLLTAETVGQATVKGLHKEFKSLERHVAAGRQQIKSLHEQARGLLHEYRCEPPAETAAAPEEPPSAEEPAAAFERHAQAVAGRVAALRGLSTPQLFIGARPVLLPIVLCAASVGVVAVANLLKIPRAPSLLISGPLAFVMTLVIVLLVGRALRRKADAQIRAEYLPLCAGLAAAERALDVRLERAREKLRRDEATAIRQTKHEMQQARDRYGSVVSAGQQRRTASREKIQGVRAKRDAEIERRYAEVLRQANERREQPLRRAHERHDHDLAAARAEYERLTSAGRGRHESSRAALESRWKTGLAHVQRLLDETGRLELQRSFDWTAGPVANWVPPSAPTTLVPFGHWQVDLARIAPSVRQSAGFLDGRAEAVAIPALLSLPNRASLLLETERAGRQEAIDSLRAVMLRLLTSLPPGRAQFTIIDPVGLGENFAGFMHLVDYEEALVGGRIWTESDHIEARLTELTAHMENVIQKYLRNEFETIDEYNQQAGQLAEPYRFLVIADLPANFTEDAARRLSSIVLSGARCGVFTLIAHDKRLPTPPELQLEDLQTGSIHLVYEGDRFVYQDELFRQFPLALDRPPSEEVLTSIMHAVGRGAKDTLRVEVPFATIAPPADQRWSSSADKDIRVPLGHTGAVRLQHLRLGRGIAQHTLIAGKTGSGKSTLLHVMITNLALWYSPEEVEFYLVDFKKGVEFKTYVTHQLPHARAIAIESDREFGISVLQRIDAEMARRGDLFRAAHVQDLSAYRAASGQLLPRTLLIVDEFQVFFAEDDKLSQDAAILLDRLVRQGRAFGIHVLLGSQTLGGTSGLARSTMGQMAVRIALQCSEADSQLILDDTNVAARLLSRPGEAVYNDAGGLVEGNSPFQTAWLPDEERNVYLEQVAALAREHRIQPEPPIVFEGNAPAEIRQNRILARLIEAPHWPDHTLMPRAWLGEAVAIKEPTNVIFRRQSGANLLVVGQRDDASLAMLASIMVCLRAQHAPDAARFVVLDGRPAGVQEEGGLHDVAALSAHQTQFVGWRDVPAAIAELARETRRRLDADETSAVATYLLIYGLQRYRMLRRQEEDFSFSTDDAEQPPAPDKLFAELLREGPPFGVHVVVWSDTLATLERTLDRQSISEFDHRVLFQMGASDSSNLIDTPEANNLGFHRALLYSEESGVMEKFRPYAAFDAEWLGHVRGCFSRKEPAPD